ncbi:MULTISPECIES: aminotransferase [Halocynthiibacter]|uniref:aspartate transaminase n=1 Tax=Halocynthiibacter halioticoli TaxID=2986804 RepID=A0AAE3IY68_9RHOB|nr:MULTISPECIES: aminotransferase [Halocynthiibacter]MCV6824184.1 aminotransferase [Halocynthiibacter halioticoli]MCW4057185.1 aminotransferase [Halocynthiibacter sp. SDUM655004]
MTKPSLARNPAMLATAPPPVMEARRWIEGVEFPSERPLLNVSQAAPVEVPPQEMRAAMADAILSRPDSHLYGAVLGRPDLRAELAGQWAAHYGGSVSAENVAITAGCNQAFAATIATLAGAGDEVIIPTPWYFNHQMWCEMQGVRAVPLPARAGLLPDPEEAASLITRRTRALVLVSPNNPGGVEYPASLIAAFRDLARQHDIALILDETYRDFHSQTGAPHDLLQDADWSDTVIQLYSFSKAYRLTGHRVGAIIAAPSFLSEIEKFLDTVTICPNQLGQIGALWGLQNLGDWLAGERREILARKDAIVAGFPALAEQGWELLGAGAYFAYMRHPFAQPSNEIAPALVEKASVLLLPGTMFKPAKDPSGARELRVAFANIDTAGISTLFDRLKTLQF